MPKIDFYTMQISEFLDCWLWEMSDDLSIGCSERIMWLDYKGCGILLALAILTHCFEFDLDTRNGEEMLVILLAEDFAYNMNDLGHKDRVISCMMWKKVDEITSKIMLIALT